MNDEPQAGGLIDFRKYFFYAIGIIFIIATIFFAIDHNPFRRIDSCSNCTEDEVCTTISEGWMGEHKACAKSYYEPIFYNTSNMTKNKWYWIGRNITNNITEIEIYPFGKGNYCMPDLGASYHKVCDIIVYPNGTNETGACVYYNDLVMHYKCKDIGNATVIKNIEVEEKGRLI